MNSTQRVYALAQRLFIYLPVLFINVRGNERGYRGTKFPAARLCGRGNT